MKIKFLGLYFISMVLVACGGGGSSGMAPLGGAPAKTVVTKLGNATLTKTLQPGVLQFDESALTVVNETIFSAPSVPDGMVVGTVFTWKDSAYVVAAITQEKNEAAKIAIRTAEFLEVMSDITLSGSLDFSSFDAARMLVTTSESQLMTARASSYMESMATSVPSNSCKENFENQKDGKISDFTCSVKFNYEDIQFGLDAGFRDAVISNVNIDFKKLLFNVGNFSITPFIRTKAYVLGGEGKALSIGKDAVPLLYMQIPIRQSLGFLHFDVPLQMDFSLPLFKFQVGSEVAFPYSNGSWSMIASIENPLTTIGTDALFKYESISHIFGVIGAELILDKTPVLKPVNFGWGKISSDRLLSIGSFFKGGWEGVLAVEVENLQSKPCLKWSLQRKAGAAIEVRQGKSPIEEFSNQKMVSFGPPISGQTECDDLGPSPGGFSNVKLACKRNADGSANITGLYTAELLPGEQITAVAWSTEYFSGMNSPGLPAYKFPDNRQFGVPAEYIRSQCSPVDGLNLNPTYFAVCHNPLDGWLRKIWVKVDGGVSPVLAKGGSVIVSFHRATTMNLNPLIPSNARPAAVLDKQVACTS